MDSSCGVGHAHRAAPVRKRASPLTKGGLRGVAWGAQRFSLRIEITAPSRATLTAINQVLAEAHEEPATQEELGPVAVN